MYVRVYIYIRIYFRWGRCLGCTRENPTRLYTRESNSFVHADADDDDEDDDDDDEDEDEDEDECVMNVWCMMNVGWM